MEAIVLTCDKYRALTDHMIFQYSRLWPDHPFRFRIPYQNLVGSSEPTCEYRRTPMDIKGTVLSLLDDLDDNQLIYWCLDDKYPITLHLPRIRELTRWMTDLPSTVSGLVFCRCRNLLGNKSLSGESISDGQGYSLLRRTNYDQIWLHQFLRVKVIRYLFQSFPNVIAGAKQMDDLKDAIGLPPTHALYVTAENLAVFGESTSRGKLTANCLQSMHIHNLPVPESLPTTNQNITMGKRPFFLRRGQWVR